MYLGSGMSFYVLPDFVIHQSHPYDEETRKAEVRAFFVCIITTLSIRKRGNTTSNCTLISVKRLAFGEFLSPPERVRNSQAVHRYLHFSLAMGELDTVKGVNLQTECQKVPGVSSLAVDVSMAGSVARMRA